MDPPSVDQLSLACAACLQSLCNDAGEPCRELLRRAFADHNDVAWDAVIVHLWPAVLAWLYEQEPELAPATAEHLVYQAMRQFRRHYPPYAHLAGPFPTFPLLMADLRACTEQVVVCAQALPPATGKRSGINPPHTGKRPIDRG